VSVLFFLSLVCVGAVVAYAEMQLIVQRPVRRLINSIETLENDGVGESVDWSSLCNLLLMQKPRDNSVRNFRGNTPVSDTRKMHIDWNFPCILLQPAFCTR